MMGNGGNGANDNVGINDNTEENNNDHNHDNDNINDNGHGSIDIIRNPIHDNTDSDDEYDGGGQLPFHQSRGSPMVSHTLPSRAPLHVSASLADH